jgi:hypothetical protein
LTQTELEFLRESLIGKCDNLLKELVVADTFYKQALAKKQEELAKENEAKKEKSE